MRLSLMLIPVLAMGASVAGGALRAKDAVEPRMPVTVDTLAAAVEAYVDEATVSSGGVFSIVDSVEGRMLDLRFQRVLMDRILKVGEGSYVMGAAFLEVHSRDWYDLDFFLSGADAPSLVVTAVMIHRKNGVER